MMNDAPEMPEDDDLRLAIFDLFGQTPEEISDDLLDEFRAYMGDHNA